jgi:hypothetical protein
MEAATRNYPVSCTGARLPLPKNVLPLSKEAIPYGGDRGHFLREVSISWHMLLPWNSASLQPVLSLVRRWDQVTEEGKEEVKPCVI